MPHVDYFIQLGDVANDGVPPKSQAAIVESDVATLEYAFATVASYVNWISTMTCGAMTAKFWVVWDLKMCSF